MFATHCVSNAFEKHSKTREWHQKPEYMCRDRMPKKFKGCPTGRNDGGVLWECPLAAERWQAARKSAEDKTGACRGWDGCNGGGKQDPWEKTKMTKPFWKDRGGKTPCKNPSRETCRGNSCRRTDDEKKKCKWTHDEKLMRDLNKNGAKSSLVRSPEPAWSSTGIPISIYKEKIMNM